MKTLLIIENDFTENSVLRAGQKITEEGGWETITIDRLKYSDKQVEKLKEIISSTKIDAILFQTTWVYQDSTAYLYSILSKIPYSLQVYNYSSGNMSLHILNAIDINTREELDTYLSMAKHKIFNVKDWVSDFEEEVWYTSHEDLEESLKDIEIKESLELDKIEQLGLQKQELKSIMLKPTDSYVKVGIMSAFGSEWSNLKEGDIVPILRTPSTDKSPNWGVWVAGLTQPVKLLNSDGAREYEYIGTKVGDEYLLEAEGLAREIVSCKRNTGIDDNSMIGMLTVKINRIHDWMGEGSIHTFVQYELLDFAGVERRCNRSYFESKIGKYYNNHKFFKELNRFEEQKFINYVN